MPLEPLGIHVPSAFPTEDHSAVHHWMIDCKDKYPEAWRLFTTGWNGLVYRYRAADESGDEFTRIALLGRPPTFEERYLQDSALFTFSVCALSTIECFFSP